jgi:DNA-binding transcriptional LysR family regulator
MKDIFALKLYTRVARLGSFSAAARECGLSQSQASRIIADLETDLGARLLSRTTRAVVPTEAGAEFLARMEPILAALDEAEHSVREGGELRGVLRMSMPTSFGIRTVIPRLSAFAARHPNLHIQLLLCHLGVRARPECCRGRAQGVQTEPAGHPMEVNLVGDSADTLNLLLPLLEQKPERSWRRLCSASPGSRSTPGA